MKMEHRHKISKNIKQKTSNIIKTMDEIAMCLNTAILTNKLDERVLCNIINNRKTCVKEFKFINKLIKSVCFNYSKNKQSLS